MRQKDGGVMVKIRERYFKAERTKQFVSLIVGILCCLASVSGATAQTIICKPGAVVGGSIYVSKPPTDLVKWIEHFDQQGSLPMLIPPPRPGDVYNGQLLGPKTVLEKVEAGDVRQGYKLWWKKPGVTLKDPRAADYVIAPGKVIKGTDWSTDAFVITHKVTGQALQFRIALNGVHYHLIKEPGKMTGAWWPVIPGQDGKARYVYGYQDYMDIAPQHPLSGLARLRGAHYADRFIDPPLSPPAVPVMINHSQSDFSRYSYVETTSSIPNTSSPKSAKGAKGVGSPRANCFVGPAVLELIDEETGGQWSNAKTLAITAVGAEPALRYIAQKDAESWEKAPLLRGLLQLPSDILEAAIIGPVRGFLRARKPRKPWEIPSI